MTLLIATAVLPAMGEINNSKIIHKEKLFPVDSDHDGYFLFHKFLPRVYYVHLPPSYDGSDSVPLVISIHGDGQSALNFSERCDINIKADDEGFIAVYPSGLGFDPSKLSWNMGFGFRLPYDLNIDDVGFIEKLIGKLLKKFNIDSNRIYIAGYSAGGMMVYHLACKLPDDLVAAYAIQSGAIGGHLPDEELWMNIKPEHPVSIVIFHGKKDYVVPFNGGWDPWRSAFFMSVPDAVSFWVDNNRCNPDPETEISESGNITIDRYSDGDDGSEIVLKLFQSSKKDL